MIPIPQLKKFAPECYFCKRATKPFTLDGDIDKDFWADADYTVDFADIEGDLRETPRFRTRAKMLWDDNNLYIAAELMGDEIWGGITKRDDVIFYDNDFEIFIDPDSDSQCYFEFEMNALNTVWDLLLTKPYRDNGTPMNGMDIKGLRSAVKIDGKINDPSAKSKRWSCEIVMPFETLIEGNKRGKIPNDGDYWRINFSRVQWKVDVIDNKFVKRTDEKTNRPLPEDNWVWSPIGLVNMHYPELWGFLFFTQNGERHEIPKDELLKWELRKVYYAQHEYKDKHGRFCDNIADLSVDISSSTQISVEATSNCFEACCESADNNHKIYIFADGAICIKQNELS